MQTHNIDVITQKQLQSTQDNQGVNWPSEQERQIRLDVRIAKMKSKSIFYQPKHFNKQCLLRSKFIDYQKFHKVQNIKPNHYQLVKCLKYSPIINQIILAYYNQLHFYNPSNYIQNTLLLQTDFYGVGVSLYNDIALLAGLQSKILLLSLINGKQEYIHITEGNDCVINQAEFMDNNQIIICDNDKQIRIFNNDNFNQTQFDYKGQHFINYCAINDSKIVVCQDNFLIPILDQKSKTIITALKGHQGYNFSACFNQLDNNQIVTASEDKTCLIWDLRNPESPLWQVEAKYQPFYDAKFTENGYLICPESYDYIHIYDSKRPSHYQCLDYFGQFSGMSIMNDKFYYATNVTDFEGIFEYSFI